MAVIHAGEEGEGGTRHKEEVSLLLDEKNVTQSFDGQDCLAFQLAAWKN